MPAGAAHPLPQAARYDAHSHWCGHCPQLHLVSWACDDAASAPALREPFSQVLVIM